jgi:hypothetical protein
MGQDDKGQDKGGTASGPGVDPRTCCPGEERDGGGVGPVLQAEGTRHVVGDHQRCAGAR